MSQWKNIASLLALSITAALAGTGCLAQQDTDEAANSDPELTTARPSEDATAPCDPKATEKTGDAKEACGFGGCGGFGGFGGCGIGIGVPFFGGCGGFGLGGYGCLPGGFFGGFPPFGFAGGCWGGCGGCF